MAITQAPMATTAKAIPCPFKLAAPVFAQYPPAQLIEAALAQQEGHLDHRGALVVNTVPYVGRSPNDRFFIDSARVHDAIAWGSTNVPMSEADFDRVFGIFQDAIAKTPLYQFDGFAGADNEHRLAVRFFTERASHNLFVHQMFIRPTADELNSFAPNFHLFCLPSLKLDPTLPGVHSEAAVIINLEKRLVLIAGTSYAGEMKKSIFTAMNFLLPTEGVLPMHCSANISPSGQTTLFFGLSGTGKTTLSTDTGYTLIGDDEHGWSNNGVFNMEGGCYAKTIRLSAKHEPDIYNAIRFGALCENQVLDLNTRAIDYDDDRYTENTRVAYPLEHIPNACPSGCGTHPTTVIFLTADAHGVMPPVAKLTPEQAQYHFLSGYTCKVAGTERGIVEPVTAFSTCFGAPFMPRRPMEYAKLLRDRIEHHGAQVFLINTGWTGGPYGVGYRIPIPVSRAIVHAAISGELAKAPTVLDPVLNLHVPQECSGVEVSVLNPAQQWSDRADYHARVVKVAQLFQENFAKMIEQGLAPADWAGFGPQWAQYFFV